VKISYLLLAVVLGHFAAAKVPAQQPGTPTGLPAGNNGNTAGQTSTPGNRTGPPTNSSATGSPNGGIIGGPPRNVPSGTGSIVQGGAQIPGAAQVGPAQSTLSLEQAIQLALQNNLSTLLAREQQREAKGVKQEALSPLLPNISGSAYQASITQNLAALGFQPGTFPGLGSTFIGPFNNFDARVRLVQTIFNLSAWENYRAGASGVKLAQWREGLAREQVASGTALLYLEVLRSDRALAAANADLELAQTLLRLAEDQRNAGVATGVDVTRAQSRLAQEQVRLAQAQASSEQSLLNLQRVVGLPLGSTMTLTDPLRFAADAVPTAEVAVAEAQQNRREINIAEEQVKQNDLLRRSASAERLPSLDFIADYGISGITPANTALPTRRVGVQLNVPIFNGGLSQGRLAVASSRARQAELELGSVRGQVEQDVRLALSGLRTASAQVNAADESVRLALRELEMARDRFAAGVGDNLEVVTAQTSLANARETQVTALAVYNAARLNLAAAQGRAETFRW
jgi:outer membrane protein TolC